jgi:uncharacterized protein (TIGR02996 family)
MTDNEALLQAICADPDNVTLRLIYADWLEEHGDAARAEFIRVQCQLAELEKEDDQWPALKERELQLLNRHGAQWLLPEWLEVTHEPRVTFRRGFVETASIRNGPSPIQLAHWYESTPLRVLQVSSPTTWSELADRPEVQRLRGLQLRSIEISTQGMRQLCGARFTALAELGIVLGRLGASEIEILASSDLGHRLETLNLSENSGMGGIGLEFLANSRQFSRIQRLDLQGNKVGDSAVRALAASPHWSSLAHLNIGNCDVTGEGVEALASSPRCSGLQRLRLEANRIGVRSCQALAGSTTLASLRSLHLDHCDLAPQALAALVKNTNRLWSDLSLGHNSEIGDASAKLIAQAPILSSLRHLNLFQCGFSPWGIKDVMWSPHLMDLQSLGIGNAHCHERFWEVLATCPPHPKLRELVIWAQEYPPEALARFGNSDRFPALQRLRLFGSPSFTDEGLSALGDTALMGQLVQLQIAMRSVITAKGVTRLFASNRASRLQIFSGARFEMNYRSELSSRFLAQRLLEPD